MPSRKKLQGQSRMAKKAASATKHNLILQCDHIRFREEMKRSQEDWDAAMTCVDHLRASSKADDCMYAIANNTYDIYEQLSDDQKELFRKIAMSLGTDFCLDKAKVTGLSELHAGIAGVYDKIIMMLAIEVRERNDGAMNENVAGEIRRSFDDINWCPRETIRFLHKRIPCDCLKDIYYKLKESTQRTSYCCNCKKIVEIRKLSRCEGCNIAQYCSHECSVASWPVHKALCNTIREDKTS